MKHVPGTQRTVSNPFASFKLSKHYHIILIGVWIVALASVFPFLIQSSYIGSAELHGMIEMVGAICGMVSGFIFIVHFWSLASRLFLFIGLAFFLNGAEDFAHGFMGFASINNWIGLPASSLAKFIPGTYVTGRFVMAIMLSIASLLPLMSDKSRNPRTETLWVCSIAVIVVSMLTVGVFYSPLPQFIFSDIVISRPVDFLSAFTFCIALGGFIRLYHRTHNSLILWVTFSIAANIVGQFIMSFSKVLYDPYFDIAHVYKVFGYIIPMLGFSLYQIQVVNERKYFERLLRNDKARMNAILDTAVSGIITISESGVVESFNKSAERMFGHTASEVIGHNIKMLMPSPFREEHDNYLANFLRTGKKKIIGIGREVVGLRKEGTTFPLDLAVSEVVLSNKRIFTGILNDITERKRIEEDLRISHKMSSIGRLTASVFHEVLNPVNIISTHTQLLLMEAEKDSTTEKDLKVILGEIKRIVDITDALLRFSRGKKLVVEEIEVNDLLENTLSVIKPEMNLKSIKLIIKFEKELPTVMAHGSELGRVLLDIITNAFDAMPEGGTLTIKTRSIRPPANRAGSANSELKGDFVEISFEDTGCGILKKDIDKVFEPFFSTKKEIKGVGLGLSESYAIIEGYGGKISVESEEGKGATFTVDLPAKTR
ncbi:MAG: PAS domain S-box protein [Candidatus Scalindua sp.]